MATLPGTTVIDGVTYESEVISLAKDVAYEYVADALAGAAGALVTASDLVDALRESGWTHPDL